VNQSIAWNPLPGNGDWDGFALLVDDVERLAGTALNFSFASLQQGIPHFFRLAVSFTRILDSESYAKSFKFQNSGVSGDFTKAATLWPNGTWTDPLPGPS
jgi:hypothetical protein